MAERQETGTGKHPDKSSADAHSHHQASSTSGGKESEEHKGSRTREGSKESSRSTETSDLKQREYRDEQGKYTPSHAHTRGAREKVAR